MVEQENGALLEKYFNMFEEYRSRHDERIIISTDKKYDTIPTIEFNDASTLFKFLVNMVQMKENRQLTELEKEEIDCYIFMAYALDLRILRCSKLLYDGLASYLNENTIVDFSLAKVDAILYHGKDRLKEELKKLDIELEDKYINNLLPMDWNEPVVTKKADRLEATLKVNNLLRNADLVSELKLSNPEDWFVWIVGVYHHKNKYNLETFYG